MDSTKEVFKTDRDELFYLDEGIMYKILKSTFKNDTWNIIDKLELCQHCIFDMDVSGNVNINILSECSKCKKKICLFCISEERPCNLDFKKLLY